MQLGALADALRVFSSLPDVPVSITETAQHLVLETSDTDEGVSMNMHAHINILGDMRIDNLLDHWKLPATEFTTYENILKEAIEDLEWPHGHVRLSIKAHPFQVRLLPPSARKAMSSSSLRSLVTQSCVQAFHGHDSTAMRLQVSLSSRGSIGELEVMLPNNHIRNPRTHGTSISHFYAYKFSKSAFTGLQGTKSMYSTHVAIDDNGLLKVCRQACHTRRSQQVPSYAALNHTTALGVQLRPAS